MKFIIRIITRTVLYTSLCLLVTLASFLLLFQLEPTRNIIINSVLSQAEKVTNSRITIGKLEGFFPFQLHISDLSIQTNEGGFFFCKSSSLAFSPISLLDGTFALSYLEIDTATVGGSFAIPFHDKGSSFPILPRKFRIKEFFVRDFRVISEFSEDHLKLITGSLSYYPYQKYGRLNASFKTQGMHLEETTLSICMCNNLEIPEIRVWITESAHGLLQQKYLSEWKAPFTFFATIHLFPFEKKFVIGDFTVDLPKGASSSKHETVIPPFQLSSSVQLDNQGLFRLSNFKGLITNKPYTVKGEVAYDWNGKEFICDIETTPLPISSLSFFEDSPISGSITFHVSSNGSIESPTISLEAKAQEVTILDCPIENFCSTIDYSNMQLKGKLNGILESFPFQFYLTSVHNETFDWDIRDISLYYRDAAVSGTLSFASNLKSLKGSLSGKIENISNIPIFSENKSGSVEFSCLFQDKNLIDISFKGIDFQFDETYIDRFSCESVLNFSDFISCSCHIEAKNMLWHGVHWDEVELLTDFNQKTPLQPFSLMASGEVDVEANGNWNLNGSSINFLINQCRGSIHDHPFTLDRPCSLNVTKNEFQLDELSLVIGPGTIVCEGSIRPELLDFSCNIDHLPVTLCSDCFLDNINMDGSISLGASLRGHPNNIEGSVTAEIEHVKLYDDRFAKLPIVNGKINATLFENTLNFSGGMEDPSAEPISLKGEIPLSLTLFPFNANVNPDEEISFDLKASGEVAPFLQFFVTNTTNVSGLIDLLIHIEGNWKEPKTTGTLSYHQGTFESLSTGALVKNIEAEIRGEEGRISILNFSGEDGEGGLVNATGTCHLDKEKNYPFEIKIDLEHAKMMRLDYARLTTTGNVLFEGTSNGGTINGDLSIDEMELMIPDQTPVQMKTVAVTYVNDPEKTNTSISNKKPWDATINITLSSPTNTYVLGRNLISEWSSNISLKGTLIQPLFSGNLQILEGKYSFNGKDFVSHQGSINFDTESGSKATIYVIGEYPMEDIKVQAIVKGGLEDPTLSFRSNPPLSQKEILSRILFNRSVDEITPFQVAELSQTIFTLSAGSPENPDVLTRLKSRIGIDRIDINREELGDHNEISLRVGKYISNGIFVSLNKSITAEANQVAIEANLLKNFKVQAEVGDNAEGKMTLKWQKDY